MLLIFKRWGMFLALLASLQAGLLRGGETRKPNVVFILADDLGWSDSQLHGTTDYYRTPHLLRLADRGKTFTRAYAASPLCSPTRASILTGLHPARLGLTTPSCHLPQVILKASQGKRVNGNMPSCPNLSVSRLDTQYWTLGKAFRKAGYATGHFGKWHLGHSPYSPLEHGFDLDVPHWPGPGPAGSYVAPWKFPDFDPDTPREHIEDRMAREAVQFIEKHREQPFFLNYWMFSVHAPFDAKPERIEKYRKRLRPESLQRSPTYAAMVESMDDAVGTLLDALEKNDLLQNTLIVFFSDNGGNMYNQVDGVPATSNAPLRGGKATLFEGGIRVPCIVSWPGKIKPGSRTDRLIQSVDFFPTLAECIDLPVPRSLGMDGESFAASLGVAAKATGEGPRSIFTYFPHQPRVPDWLPPAATVHQDHWKLVRVFHGATQGAHRHMLFDLKNDLSETSDQSQQHPEVVARLSQELDRFLQETDAVQPAKNPDFDFASYDFSQEGRAALKMTGKKGAQRKQPSGAGRSPVGRSVAGWQPDHQVRLVAEADRLVIHSSGKDPHLSRSLVKPLPPGKYVVRLSMSSKGGGSGQFFWEEVGVAPKFHRDRSQIFKLVHDGQVHDYRIEIEPGRAVSAIRLDPGRQAGRISIHEFSIHGGNSETWDLLKGKR
ncbi:MAG: sulfatase [Planctomycetota bacterium]|nr:sulfatase [Planctomycetota bacterium]